LLCCGYDVVKGSRYCVGGGSEDLTLVRSAGNIWLTRLANVLYGARWTDLCYGYIALRRSVVDLLGLEADGFEIETELCVNAIRVGLRIAEVPSYELNRRSGVSKLSAPRDGLRVLGTMVRTRWPRPRPVRVPAVPTPSVPTPSVPTPSVPTPSVPTPSVPTPSVPTPSVPTSAVPTPARPPAGEHTAAADHAHPAHAPPAGHAPASAPAPPAGHAPASGHASTTGRRTPPADKLVAGDRTARGDQRRGPGLAGTTQPGSAR
jgi:hypothetical protein